MKKARLTRRIQRIERMQRPHGEFRVFLVDQVRGRDRADVRALVCDPTPRPSLDELGRIEEGMALLSSTLDSSSPFDAVFSRVFLARAAPSQTANARWVLPIPPGPTTSAALVTPAQLPI
jgi:hypothetical protein